MKTSAAGFPNANAYAAVAPFYDLHAPDDVLQFMDFWKFAVGQHSKAKFMTSWSSASELDGSLLDLRRQATELLEQTAAVRCSKSVRSSARVRRGS